MTGKLVAASMAVLVLSLTGCVDATAPPASTTKLAPARQATAEATAHLEAPRPTAAAWEAAALDLTTITPRGGDPTRTALARSTRSRATPPASWVPVAYGDAQVSVPATWDVMTHSWCAAQSPIVELGDVEPSSISCVTTPPLPAVKINDLGTVPAPYRHEKPVLINGISALPGPQSLSSVSYFVPSLHVELWAANGAGGRVLDTLAASPRATVLAGGLAPAVPASWQTVSFAGLRLSVPANWPVTRTSGTPAGLGNLCSSPGVAFPDNTAALLSFGVTLSTDAHLLAPPVCATGSHYNTVQPPMDGVQVDSGRHPHFQVTLSFPKQRCFRLHGLTACPGTAPAYSILVVWVNVPGRAVRVLVSIGLGGDGAIARTILHSLRAA